MRDAQNNVHPTGDLLSVAAFMILFFLLISIAAIIQNN
jgi:hypothetical protein